MAGVGDVYVTLRMDSTGFERGVASARSQAGALGRDLSGATSATEALSESAGGLGERFNLGARTMDRFAALGVQHLIPSLDGSRLALEGVFQGIYRLTGGYASLVLGGVAVAGLFGGAVYAAFRNQEHATVDAYKGVNSLSDSITKLQAEIDANIPALDRWARLAHLFGHDIGDEFTNLLGDPTGIKFFGDRYAMIAERVKGLRDTINVLKGAELLEDPKASGIPTEAEARSLFDLEKAVRSFVSTSGAAFVDDPLQKLLIGEWQKTQALIDKTRELTNVTIAERDAMIGAAAAQGGVNQISARDQFSKAQGPGAATRLGLGDTNLFAGFRDIKQLRTDIDTVREAITGLARDGAPASAIFDQIADAQAKLDQRFADLKVKFADSPALFNKVVEAERELGGGSFQRDLDAQVRSIQDLTQGGYDTIRAFKDTKVVMDDTAVAFDAVDIKVITLTGDVYALAEAFNSMRIQALAAAGASASSGGTVAVPGPGNFSQ